MNITRSKRILWGWIPEPKSSVSFPNGIALAAAFVFGDFAHSRSNLIQSSIISDIVPSSVLTSSAIYARMLLVVRMRSSRVAFLWTFTLSSLFLCELFLRRGRLLRSTSPGGDSGRVGSLLTSSTESSLFSRIIASSFCTSTWPSFSSTGPPPINSCIQSGGRRFVHSEMLLRLVLTPLVEIATRWRL